VVTPIISWMIKWGLLGKKILACCWTIIEANILDELTKIVNTCAVTKEIGIDKSLKISWSVYFKNRYAVTQKLINIKLKPEHDFSITMFKLL
jgi:hypothetical protein